MADTFGLEIYASNKLAFAGRAKTLTIPAVDGEQAFLAQHENIVAAIIPGEMRFEEDAGKSSSRTTPIAVGSTSTPSSVV